ncbi:UvrD-helicase domain-containing protein [Bacillus licheniformis]|nr:UvrD-helicase domain-containing protein [Bacillus licheniformis]
MGKRVHRLYRHYEEQKQRGANSISTIWHLRAGSCFKNSRTFKAISDALSRDLIDEFQDINPVQYAIIKLLASPETT